MRALLIVSTNPRGALTATRKLHEAGWTVLLGSPDPQGLVSWSRAQAGTYLVPPPERGVEAYLEAVARATRDAQADIVIPCGDADLLALSYGRDRIPAVVPLAADAVVRRHVDKLELARAAGRAGLAALETLPADEQSLRSWVFPAVVKPRFHWLPEHPVGAPARLEAAICSDADSARRAAEAIRAAGGEPLLQQVASGELVNVHLVADRSGRVLGLDQTVSVPLTFPPGAGMRVRATTVPVEPELETGIRALLVEGGWFGFAGIAFKRGPDGIAYVIDFNGRVPAQLEASAGAGPNFMAAWAALAAGLPVPPLEPSRIGTRFQWLEGDLRRAFRERRGGLLRDVAGTLAYAIGANHTVARRSQPVLALRYTARQIRESRFLGGARHGHSDGGPT